MRLALGSALVLATALPLAAEADQQEVAMTAELAAAPDEVWSAIGDFQDMSWHPAVFSSDGEGGNEPGASRVLTLGEEGGPTISESLDERSGAEMSYSYRITEVDPAVLPVTNYTSTLAVVPHDDGKATVQWRGSFDPPAGTSDEDAVAAVSGVYKAGLDALEEQFGTAD